MQHSGTKATPVILLPRFTKVCRMSVKCFLLLGLVLTVAAENTRLKEVFSWKSVEFVFPKDSDRADAIKSGSFIPENNLPLGLDVWKDKLFITVPRWKAGVVSSLNYVDISGVEIPSSEEKEDEVEEEGEEEEEEEPDEPEEEEEEPDEPEEPEEDEEEEVEEEPTPIIEIDEDEDEDEEDDGGLLGGVGDLVTGGEDGDGLLGGVGGLLTGDSDENDGGLLGGVGGLLTGDDNDENGGLLGGVGGLLGGDDDDEDDDGLLGAVGGLLGGDDDDEDNDGLLGAVGGLLGGDDDDEDDDGLLGAVGGLVAGDDDEDGDDGLLGAVGGLVAGDDDGDEDDEDDGGDDGLLGAVGGLVAGDDDGGEDGEEGEDDDGDDGLLGAVGGLVAGDDEDTGETGEAGEAEDDDDDGGDDDGLLGAVGGLVAGDGDDEEDPVEAGEAEDDDDGDDGLLGAVGGLVAGDGDDEEDTGEAGEAEDDDGDDGLLGAVGGLVAGDDDDTGEAEEAEDAEEAEEAEENEDAEEAEEVEEAEEAEEGEDADEEEEETEEYSETDSETEEDSDENEIPADSNEEEAVKRIKSRRRSSLGEKKYQRVKRSALLCSENDENCSGKNSTGLLRKAKSKSKKIPKELSSKSKTKKSNKATKAANMTDNVEAQEKGTSKKKPRRKEQTNTKNKSKNASVKKDVSATNKEKTSTKKPINSKRGSKKKANPEKSCRDADGNPCGIPVPEPLYAKPVLKPPRKQDKQDKRDKPKKKKKCKKAKACKKKTCVKPAKVSATSPALIPYPNLETNTPSKDSNDVKITSVFRIRVDVCDRLWVMDTGIADILGNTIEYSKPQILIYNLNDDKLIKKYVFKPEDVQENTFFANIIVDVEKSKCENAFAYVPDLGSYAIVVYDLKNDKAWRIKHHYFHFNPLEGNYNVGGVNFQWTDGVFGIALTKPNPDSSRTAYFHALSSYSEFMVNTFILQNENEGKESNYTAYQLVGNKGPNSQTSASFIHERTGVMFYTQVNKDAVYCWNTAKPFTSENLVEIASDSETMVFPNDLKVDYNDNLWVLTDKLPVFVINGLDSKQVNYRIFVSPVSQAFKDTNCAP